MRSVKVLAIAGFSIACVAVMPEEDSSVTYKPDVGKSVSSNPALESAKELLMRCEHGCPGMMPYINIMPINTTDTKDASDSVSIPDAVEPGVADADAGVSSPDACGDTYEFSVCCGDEKCQRSESSFFCPEDCL